jgi:hypothetical protein
MDAQTPLRTLNNLGNAGGRGGRGGGGGGGGFAGTGNANDPVSLALAELNQALQDPNSTDDLIRVKLKVFRDARSIAKSTLTEAQRALVVVLTLRQESVLVILGYLE